MKVYSKIGSKERLLEMMKGVTKEDKVTINEDVEFEPLVKIPKKQDSQPYGGSKHKYQDGMGYGDEKPVNPELRVKSPELEKFVKERSESEKGLEGEDLLKKNFSHLNSDMEFKKMAQAYENLLKLAQSKHRAKYVTQTALSSLRDMITDYLNKEKGLAITDQDVQNFFTNWMDKFSGVVSEEKDGPCWDDYEMVGMKEKGGKEVPNCVPKNEEEEEKKEIEPAELDPTDTDNDGDFVEGGLGDDAEVSEFEPAQIIKGMEVEMEHTSDPKVALEIAMDHLVELPDYYTRLEKMEKRGEEDLEQGEFEKLDGDETNPEEFAVDREEMEDEFSNYFDDLEKANDELKNNMLGFDIETPNTSEDYDYAAAERNYADKGAYNRYLELDAKDFNNLSDDEKDEFFELWKEFGHAKQK